MKIVIKIPSLHNHFPWVSMTYVIFHDVPGLENGLKPWSQCPTRVNSTVWVQSPIKRCDHNPRLISTQLVQLWDIVWVSPQGHRSVSVSRHFLLQAPQCPCSMRKRFSRDHCCWGRSKPGYRIKYILPNYQKKASGKDSSIINDCYNGLIPQTNMLLALI